MKYLLYPKMIDCDTFVKATLSAMWMLNDLPRSMRKDLDSQLGVIWLLIGDRNCFPSLEFTSAQQEAICKALAASSPPDEEFKYTYEALMQMPNLKIKHEENESANAAAAPGDGEGEEAIVSTND